MQNFIKTIINGIQSWTKKEIKKNRTHWEDEIEVFLIPETTITIDEEGYHSFGTIPYGQLIVGKTYNVLLNGIKYECVARSYDGYILIGNGKIYGDGFANNNEPFSCDSHSDGEIYLNAAVGEYTISISGVKTVIHKLDSKYLPTNLATTDDVNRAKQKVLDATETNKMNKFNPVGTGSFSMGRKAGTTVGSNSHAEGSNTTASHFASHAEGWGTIASGERAHAEGCNTKATNYNTHAEGYSTQATGINAHAEGEGTIASGDISHAEGHETTSSNSSSHAEGWKTIASGQRSHAEGYNTKATSYNTHAEGYNTQAINTNAHAEGNGTIASGQQAHAEGSGSGTQIKLTGDANSVTYTVNSGMGYIEVGRMLKYNETIVKIVNCDSSTKTVTTQNTLSASALNSQSVQLYSGIASGNSSHSEGDDTTASGNNSHAEGNGTIASGQQAHAEGYSTIASGSHSHAEGGNTTASGVYSHAEGSNTIANNALMHVFGKYNIFDNQKHTMTEGFEDLLFVDSTNYFADEYTFDNETGLFSLINPSQDYTNDDVEKLIGKYTLNRPTSDAAESALWKVIESTEYDGVYIGRYFYSGPLTQIEGKYVHIVGNGTADDTRSNAHTLDWNGVGWFQGGLQVGGNAQDDGAKNVLLEGDAIPVPVSATVGQTIIVKSVDENGKPVEWETTDISTSGGNVNLGVTGATVGQTVKISAVNENGVPTAWEPMDVSYTKPEIDAIMGSYITDIDTLVGGDG